MEEFKQTANEIEIIGLIKSINLEKDNSLDAIKGYIVVEVVEEDVVNNIRVELFSKQFKKDGSENSLYKGYVTINDEYKSIDNDGRENADYVRVTGRINGNMYASRQDGSLHESVRVQGTFVNRIDKEKEQQALAQMDLLIKGMTDIADSEGIPTGDKRVEAYFVEYGNKVSKMTDLEVHGELADQFDQLFASGDTAQITMKIQNYASNVEATPEISGGFGVQKNLSAGSNFTRNFVIVGGSMPYQEPLAFSEDQINDLMELYTKRKETVSELNNGGISKQQTSGFGNAQTVSGNPFEGGNTNTNSSNVEGWDF